MSEERRIVEQVRAAALNEAADVLSRTTTIEEARGVALLMIRGLLDLIRQEPPAVSKSTATDDWFPYPVRRDQV